jgi:hypothetical protein
MPSKSQRTNTVIVHSLRCAIFHTRSGVLVFKGFKL